MNLLSLHRFFIFPGNNNCNFTDQRREMQEFADGLFPKVIGHTMTKYATPPQSA